MSDLWFGLSLAMLIHRILNQCFGTMFWTLNFIRLKIPLIWLVFWITDIYTSFIIVLWQVYYRMLETLHRYQGTYESWFAIFNGSYYDEKQCMFFTMMLFKMLCIGSLWIYWIIMDLLDHSGFSYENTWSCFHLM